MRGKEKGVRVEERGSGGKEVNLSSRVHVQVHDFPLSLLVVVLGGPC